MAGSGQSVGGVGALVCQGLVGRMYRMYRVVMCTRSRVCMAADLCTRDEEV